MWSFTCFVSCHRLIPTGVTSYFQKKKKNPLVHFHPVWEPVGGCHRALRVLCWTVCPHAWDECEQRYSIGCERRRVDMKGKCCLTICQTVGETGKVWQPCRCSEDKYTLVCEIWLCSSLFKRVRILNYSRKLQIHSPNNLCDVMHVVPHINDPII